MEKYKIITKELKDEAKKYFKKKIDVYKIQQSFDINSFDENLFNNAHKEVHNFMDAYEKVVKLEEKVKKMKVS